MFRKKVRIAGRSVSLATSLLAVMAVTALAWGLYVAFSGTGSVEVQYQAAPSEPSVTISAGLNVTGGTVGDVVTQPIVDPVAHTINGGVLANINETSQWTLNVTVTNNTNNANLMFDLPSPVTSCFDVSFMNGTQPPFPIAPLATGYVTYLFAGNANTFDCAMNPNGPIVFDYSITPQ